MNTVNILMKGLGIDKITIPVITRDGDYVHHWFSGYKRELLGNNTPEQYFKYCGIQLEIITFINLFVLLPL